MTIPEQPSSKSPSPPSGSPHQLVGQSDEQYRAEANKRVGPQAGRPAKIGSFETDEGAGQKRRQGTQQQFVVLHALSFFGRRHPTTNSDLR